jgi:predicted Zn finger-like uncharacterized protein
MILTCPQCATRYQADAAKFLPPGRNVRCAKCGHMWHQDAAAPEPVIAADVAIADVPSPEPVVPPPEPVVAPPVLTPPAEQPVIRPAAYAPSPVIARAPMQAPPPEQPAIRPAAYVPSPVVVRAPVQAPPPRTPSNWPMRLAVGAGWLALIAIVLLIGWSALRFRQQIAMVWPQSASLYSAVGLKANASGINIQDVSYHRSVEDGQTVLSVTGVLTNTSSRELPVPQLRVGLSDDDRHELYHWTFVPGVLTLKPGQSTKFLTRLSNPPEGAHHFELRFARAGE